MKANVLQTKFNAGAGFNIGLIAEYINDREIDPTDVDNRDGVDLKQRYRNTVLGAKIDGSIGDYVDLKGAYYYTDFSTDFSGGNFVRWTPTLIDDADDSAWVVDLSFSELFDGALTINVQGYSIGSDYQSVLASRREADVLLTEGHDATWGWSRPDYNRGSNDRGSSRALR